MGVCQFVIDAFSNDKIQGIRLNQAEQVVFKTSLKGIELQQFLNGVYEAAGSEAPQLGVLTLITRQAVLPREIFDKFYHELRQICEVEFNFEDMKMGVTRYLAADDGVTKA